MYKTIVASIITLCLIIPGVVIAQDKNPDSPNHKVSLKWYVKKFGVTKITKHKQLREGKNEYITWEQDKGGFYIESALVRRYVEENNTHTYGLVTQVTHPKGSSISPVVELTDVPDTATAEEVLVILTMKLKALYDKAYRGE